MRASTVIYLLLIVGMISVAFGIYGSELDQAYPNDNDINTSFEDDYDVSTEIQTKTEGLRDLIQKVGDENEGWFTRIGSGIIALPWAVINFFGIAFFGMDTGLNFLTSIATYFKIDPRLILAVVVLGGTAIVFVLLEWFQRSKA